MRKLILQEFVTVDGYAADEKGSTAFFENLTGENGREIDTDLLTFIGTIDTIILGTNTYRMFADYWPAATVDKEMVADALNSTPKIVFSKSLKEAPWGKWEKAKVISGNPVSEINKLKHLPGKDMVIWGSISLVQSLLESDIIDEIQLRVCPVAMGKGLPVFRRNLPLHLLETKQYKCGVVLFRYSLR